MSSNLGERIKEERKRAGLTQDALARLSGLNFGMIAKLEGGYTPNPTLETVRKVADALGMRIDELIK